MMAVYEFSAPERGLLIELCRCRDTLERLAAAQAGRVLSAPLLAEQRQQQIVFARLFAVLRLPDVEDNLARPQRRGGVREPYRPTPRLKVLP
jgi:hypothetical protein